MKRLFLIVSLSICPALVAAPHGNPATSAAPTRSTLKDPALDGALLERELQRLSWPQFKSVIEAEPRLKAGVDAYGPLGWQFVQANYQRYGWKKNIDKLDDGQRRHLAELIARAKSKR